MEIRHRYEAIKIRITLLLVICFVLTSCGGGTKVLKEPQQVETTRPLVSADNSEISVALDWIIVSNGPGSWARNAYWDEYLVRVHNSSSQALSVTDIVVYDSKGHPNRSLPNRKSLVKNSKKTIRRYKDSNIDVNPGMGAGQLLATSGAVTVSGVGIVYAAASTAAPYGGASAGAGAAAAVGVGLVLAGPIVAVAAIKRSSDNKEVDEEIKNRRSRLPVGIASDETRSLHLFFPIAVSPSHIVISYEIGGTAQNLTIDTFQQLIGLHLDTLENSFSEPASEFE